MFKLVLRAYCIIKDIGSELFGTSSRNGFEVLRALDSNGDNQITRADTEYGSLRIWRDANSDGISQASELVTLDAAGIAANDNCRHDKISA